MNSIKESQQGFLFQLSWTTTKKLNEKLHFGEVRHLRAFQPNWKNRTGTSTKYMQLTFIALLNLSLSHPNASVYCLWSHLSWTSQVIIKWTCNRESHQNCSGCCKDPRAASCSNSTAALPLLFITFQHLKLNASHLNANTGVSRVERWVIQRTCKQLRKEECRRWQFNYREAHDCCSLHGVCLLCLLAEAMTGVELDTLISRSGSLSKTCTGSLILNLAVTREIVFELQNYVNLKVFLINFNNKNKQVLLYWSNNLSRYC